MDQTIGPLLLAPSPDVESVGELDPSYARSLCGQSIDWIEAVR